MTGIRGHSKGGQTVTERARVVVGADGIHSAVARAVSNMATVAISPASPEMVVSSDTFADFGTLVLSPCGSSCP